jgi:hypothetical protein
MWAPGTEVFEQAAAAPPAIDASMTMASPAPLRSSAPQETISTDPLPVRGQHATEHSFPYADRPLPWQSVDNQNVSVSDQPHVLVENDDGQGRSSLTIALNVLSNEWPAQGTLPDLYPSMFEHSRRMGSVGPDSVRDTSYDTGLNMGQGGLAGDAATIAGVSSGAPAVGPSDRGPEWSGGDSSSSGGDARR